MAKNLVSHQGFGQSIVSREGTLRNCSFDGSGPIIEQSFVRIALNRVFSILCLHVSGLLAQSGVIPQTPCDCHEPILAPALFTGTKLRLFAWLLPLRIQGYCAGGPVLMSHRQETSANLVLSKLANDAR
jgi:hypothetical protein